MKKFRWMALVCVLILMATAVVSTACAEVNIGDYVTFGHYRQTKQKDDTPIEWLVLDIQDGKALLITRYGIDNQKYNSSTTAVTWEHCFLRSWLNSTFMNVAFTDDEKNVILLTDVDNSASQGYWETDAGNDTQDQVFLLSYAEANRYFNVNADDEANIAARIAPTAYAYMMNAHADSACMTSDGDGAGWWWLRSPAESQSDVACVQPGGYLKYHSVTAYSGCVRPAMWVDLKSGAF